jgi:trimethylamine--corrinoid protein Co-methyltransferase
VVIDNEILDAAFVMARGMEVNDDTLAVDVIKEVGPGGNYLSHEHTVKYLRKDCWFPRIVVRDRYEAWQASGGKDMLQRANEMARKILAEHHPAYVDDKTKAELDRLAIAQQDRVINKGRK